MEAASLVVPTKGRMPCMDSRHGRTSSCDVDEPQQDFSVSRVETTVQFAENVDQSCGRVVLH